MISLSIHDLKLIIIHQKEVLTPAQDGMKACEAGAIEFIQEDGKKILVTFDGVDIETRKE